MVDVVVIGGGIAGVSAAYFLAEHHEVLLLEAEQSLAFHTTGRSAAILVRNYGADSIRPLTAASVPFLESPPPALVDAPLLAGRGTLHVATKDQEGRLEQLLSLARRDGLDSHHVEPQQLPELCSAIRSERFIGGLFEPGDQDIDVAALHQAFVRGLRHRNAQIETGNRVDSMTWSAGRWTISAGAASWRAGVVVNAAGAWGDEIARLAGANPVGLHPLRRTAFMVAGDEAWSGWPMVADVDHNFYFKADGPQILCSPADETPDQPSDARHREADVALAIDRINEATTLDIRSVRTAWAGLRTFTPDRGMAIGFDPHVDGFFWLVGQGGTGIQTSPAAGLLTSALIVHGQIPSVLTDAGLTSADIDPGRFG